MRMRRFLRTVILMLCMAAVLAFTAAAAEKKDSQSAVTAKKVSGKTYLYYKDTGKKVKGLTGLQELPKGSKNYYYFQNNKGRIYASGWFNKGKNYYYASKNGKLKSGWQTIGKKRYFFNRKTLVRSTGWKNVNGKYYYFNSKGAQVTKWLKWKKYTFYLDPANGHARTTGWKTIDKKTYYFNSKGRMQTGWFTVNGKKYYANKSGVRKTGLVTINGKKYYLDKKDNGAMKTGWVTVKGKKYYMSKSGSKKGQAVTGWMTSGKSRYYFNSSGVMQKGWLTLGNKKYYLNPSNGKMVTGKKTISGKTYDFGKKGYLTTTPTGAWSIKVNQGTNVVTVYRGSTPVKAMLCSVGLNGATPNGIRYITDKLRWHELMGPSWGQYCEHLSTSPNSVWSSYLFHSVPYNRYRDPRSMSASAYNMLGQAASHGCIRLNVESAKYIYDNVPIGTKVTIFRGTSANDPLGKPSLKKIPSWQTWDPTDPNI